MIGRAAGGEEADRGVDDGAFVHHPAHRPVIRAVLADGRQPVDRSAGERRAQRRAGRDERRAGDVQPHQFNHHLVGIGGAVEGAGAGRVIGLAFAFQQIGTGRLAFGIELADLLLFLVADPRRHRAGGDEDRRKEPEAQRADNETRHDLVTDAKQRHAIEHRVAERDRSGQRDSITAEQRQLHPVLPLRDPVAHRRNPARDLSSGADFARIELHRFRVAAIGLVRREHIVEGGDDAKVGRTPGRNRRLIFQRGGEAVGKVGAGEEIAVPVTAALALHQLEIAGAARFRFLDYPRSDAFNDGVEAHRVVLIRAR